MHDVSAWNRAAEALLGALAWEVAFSTVVFAAVYLLCRAWRRRGPVLRHALWSLVLVRLLLPPGLSHPLAAGSLVQRLLGSARGALGGSEVSPAAAAPPVLELASDAVPLPAAPWVSWAGLLVLLWLLGVAVSLAVYLRRCAVYRGVLRQARPVSEGWALAVAGSWRRRLRIRRPVTLCTSGAAVSPFTAGSLRPVVFLPRAVLRDARVAEAAIAHELAHVARWDSLWLRLQHLVQVFYFFHPVAWAAGAELDREREHICDAMVLAQGVMSPRQYAASLLAVLEQNPRGLAVPTMTTQKRRWTMRIRSILAPGSDENRPRAASAAVLAFAVALFLLPLAGGNVGADAAAGEAPPAGEPSTTGTLELSNPLPGSRISASWGEMKDPWNQEKTFHRGIDLVAEVGTPILAPADGVVEVATTHYEPSEASGTVVIVDHGGGLKTRYAHLGALEVEEGQRVARHHVLARVGNSGRSTGPHLHFETWRDGEPTDPAELLPEWRR